MWTSWSFFGVGSSLAPGLVHRHFDELLRQGLELGMPRQSRLHGRHFGRRHVAGVVLALLPALELVEGPVAAPARLGAKLAAFHAGEGVHFLEDFLATLEWSHAEISSILDIPCQTNRPHALIWIRLQRTHGSGAVHAKLDCASRGC